MEKGALRLAFTGPESSGKTTLANWCAAHFELPVIEEFARTYLQDRPTYVRQDLDIMAQQQVALWPSGGFVADTEMHVFQIWSDVKYAEVSLSIQDLLKAQQFDHYFLCAPDIPWEEDPLRENPHDRQQLFALYLKQLEENNRSYTILEGPLEKRQELIKVRVLSFLNA
ncbi:MAG: AAA family ATPase [Flavobacteriales bacterium]